MDILGQSASEGEAATRQRAFQISGALPAAASVQHRRTCARNSKQSAYYHQVKTAAVAASAVTWNSVASPVDENTSFEQQHDGPRRSQVGGGDPRSHEADSANPADSIRNGTAKPEWSFAPAAAPKFMASAAWAGSRAAGAVDVLGGAGVESGKGPSGVRGTSEWGFPDGGQGEVRGGWLLKKAESSWGWRRRWFVLYPGRLTYQVGEFVSCLLW